MSAAACPIESDCADASHAYPSVDVLQRATGRLIKAFATSIVLGETEDAALVILSQPAIRSALLAEQLLEQVRDRHREVPWGGSKVSTVCACGASWPCDDAVLLGAAIGGDGR